MGLGVLEDKYPDNVPGTALLSELGIVRGQEIVIGEAANLKRGSGRYSHVVLVPQPSDDPNDPLNWPRWKKEACFWTLVFMASLDGALSPMVGPGYVLLAEQFGVSVDVVASSFGTILLGLGSFMMFQNVLATKFGHRIVYLISVFLMFLSCVWCALSPNLASVRASRLFQGLGMSSLQSLVASTIEQIYFVHERGSRTVIWSFAIMSGITLGPLLYSYVVQNLSWQMGFWLVTIPFGISLVLTFFFVPETSYIREVTVNPAANETEKQAIEDVESSQEARIPARKSFVSGLQLYHGTFTKTNVIKIFVRPFPFLISPVTWFLFLVLGMQTVWLSLMPICSATIFTIEYDFDATEIGLTNLGGIVAVVLAVCTGGPLTDWGTVWMSKRNKGIYEPEFRIIFLTTMLFGVFGYAGWAVGTTRNMPWIGAVLCLAMPNYCMVISGSAAITYLLDTHGDDALHVLAIVNFAKNMVLYGFTFFANGFIESRGVKNALLILAGLQAACWASTIPMYIFGKRVRSWVARHPRLFIIAGAENN
ncbi:unnamed protein product [Cyclocybe aegerita]|uniref:Major facilitator superfamily (MFS) profile domain-containing protein n=1 Tax=Cyclocybe aegerita TaxID=1973307 RepID=A0A8S0VT24_CYCAE|nr:unnamed protein product [Cyclocybe aegerita]